MAKKAKKPGGAKKSPPTLELKSGGLPPMISSMFGQVPPEILEQLIRQIQGPLEPDLGAPDDSPAGQARALVYEAQEASPVRRKNLIAQALKLDSDCIEALISRGDDSPSADVAIAHYQDAIAAGRRALGDAYDKMVGEMWMFVEARSYLEARLALADTLADIGRHAEAIEQYQEILRLNPNDNQGVRDPLLALYFNLERHQEALELLNRYDEHSAVNAYGKVLFTFRVAGECPEVETLLKAARKVNKHVPGYLLGDKPLPANLPGLIGMGDVDEAVVYASAFLPAWKATPGAISWLRTAVAPVKKSRSKKSTLTIKTPEATPEELLALPQDTGATWQFDLRQMPMWVDNHAGRQVRPVRPWLALVVSLADGMVLGHEMCLDQPAVDTQLRLLTKAMLKPFERTEPTRPASVQMCRHEAFNALQPRLNAIGVRSEICDDLLEIDRVCNAMTERALNAENQPAMLDIPGISDADFEAYYDAAASYYRRAPWRKIPGDTILEVTIPTSAQARRYAIVMGQSGIELGIAFYEDLAFLRKLVKGKTSQAEMLKKNQANSILFGEDFGMSARDVDAIERRGWNLAEPEAYPFAVSVRPPMQLELPSLDTIRFATLAMLAIPVLLADRQATIDVPLGDETHRVMIQELP